MFNQNYITKKLELKDNNITFNNNFYNNFTKTYHNGFI